MERIQSFMKADIIVIGGGASGMMAAVCAARQGAGVLILERMPRIGKKLLATGNGRCNYTNEHMDPALVWKLVRWSFTRRSSKT